MKIYPDLSVNLVFSPLDWQIFAVVILLTFLAALFWPQDGDKQGGRA